ncbi:MAG: hypothetical protein WC528_01765 [Patescibacteria group bacterium]
MPEKERDFLVRKPIRVSIIMNVDVSDWALKDKLPEGYICGGGVFSFPAGYRESYIVNGKEYNCEGNLSLEEQRADITHDLTEGGFSLQEAEEYMVNLKTVEWSVSYLNYDASQKWLELHPEFEDEAMKILKEAINELKAEGNEQGRRVRR